MKRKILNTREYRRTVFGNKEAMTALVRSAIKTDPAFLTDTIILAPLHTEIARQLCSDFENLIYYGGTAKDEYKTFAFLKLCGSICHALNSRANTETFKSFAETDWLAKSRDFYQKADALEIAWRLTGKYGKTKVKA